MKRAFSLIISAAIGVAFSTSSLAQTAGPNGQSGTLAVSPNKVKGGAYNERRTAAALKEILPTLNLTPEQQSQITALSQKTHDQLTQIRKETKGGDSVVRHDKLVKLEAAFRDRLFSVLTRPQGKQFRQSYKAFMKKWRQDHKKQTPAGGTPPATAPPATPATTGG